MQFDWSNIDQGLVYVIVTPGKVEWAVSKIGGGELLTQLTYIFAGSLLLDCTAQLSTDVNISFISKIGRINYAAVKAFRPISLSSYRQ